MVRCFQDKLEWKNSIAPKMYSSNLSMKLKLSYYELHHFRQNLKLLSKNLIVVDNCELKLSGISYASSFNPFTIINKILTFCNTSGIITQVIYWRNWNPPNTAVTKSTNIGALVFQATSAIVRNPILLNTFILRSHKAQSIFGMGGASKVYLSTLWPWEFIIFSAKLKKLLLT